MLPYILVLKHHIEIFRKNNDCDFSLSVIGNIKKGSKLLLEGVVDRDENGKPVNLRFPNNGTSRLPEGREIVDEYRGRDYIDMQNLIRVDGCQLHGPKNKENKFEAPNSHLYFVRALKLGKSR